PFARGGAQTDDAVGEQVVAHATGAVKVVGRRASGRIHESALLVERHTRPRIRTACVLPRVSRPRVVAELARVRNRVEGPSFLARAHIERPDVTRRRREPFRHDRSQDDEVVVENAWRVDANTERARIAALEPLTQIDPAVLTKTGNRLPGRSIERIEPVPRS